MRHSATIHAARVLAASLILASTVPLHGAESATWQGTAGSDWFDAANWDLARVPGDNDAVLIDGAAAASGHVVLSNATAALASCIVTNATLVFTNWTTCLQAATVEVRDQGLLTLPPAFRETEMSNRVWIVCSNLTVAGGGMINVSGEGFAGGTYNTSGHGHGPGKGAGHASGSRAGGGGYGGPGGYGHRLGLGWYLSGGLPYGTAGEAAQPGSGGGGPGYVNSYGGAGGGAVRIEAAGDVVCDGAIAANGTAGSQYGGGGSGGGISIVCGRFGGQGTLLANGGKPGTEGGGGGGGRVAVMYATLLGPPAVRIETKEALGTLTRWDTRSRWTNRWMSAYGTIAFSDTQMLSRTLTNYYGTIIVPGLGRWAPESLAISNGVVGFEPGFSLEVAGDLEIGPAAALELPRGSFLRCGDLRVPGGRLWMNGCTQLVCGADLAVTGGGAFYAYAPPAAGGARHGMSVDVAGELRVGKDSWILPTTDPTNGAPVRFRCARLVVEAAGGFDAIGRGLSGAAPFIYGSYAGWGDGAGVGHSGYGYGSGGGYGGRGGWSWKTSTRGWHYAGGPAYGCSNAVPAAGSGGGTFSSSYGGHGGGMIWIESCEQARIDGILKANGGLSIGYSGGGSGGGILIVAPRLTGADTAVLRADGGNPTGTSGGPGGGGRIVVATGLTAMERGRLLSGVPSRHFTATHPVYQGTWSVAPASAGPDYTGEEWRTPQPGSVLFIASAGGTILLVR